MESPESSPRGEFFSEWLVLWPTVRLFQPCRSSGHAERTHRTVFAADPFALGVASGDPTDTGVVLWTRPASKPPRPDNGLPPEAVL